MFRTADIRIVSAKSDKHLLPVPGGTYCYPDKTLKQTSTPRCFIKGGTKYCIWLPCGCRSNDAPVQVAKIQYSTPYRKFEQRGIKENLRYHESVVLKISGQQIFASYRQKVINIFSPILVVSCIVTRQNVETDFSTPLFYKKICGEWEIIAFLP